MEQAGIVIIGAGQAGWSVASALRANSYSGPIFLIGDEPYLPYRRPPLSKAYLMGELELDRLYLRPEAYYDEQNITVVLGQPVKDVDRTGKTVTVGDRTIPYDHLVLATGSVPHRLPEALGGKLDGTYTIRGIDDVDRASHEFTPGRKLLIVGGGYIGLEIAAVAAKLGLDVTLVEAAPRILQRVAAEETSRFFHALHTENGVSVQENAPLERLTGQERVSGAILANGDTLDADFVIFGMGIAPNTRLAENAGLKVDNGIWTNAYGQTSDPDIWAVGDCASFPYRDRHIRLESVGHAIDHGEVVAANILGEQTDYRAAPWFWSDQFDVKLQIAGLSSGYDTVITRSADDGTSHWYFDGDRLIAVDAMNGPRAYMTAKRLMEAGESPKPADIADPNTDLRSLLKDRS